MMKIFKVLAITFLAISATAACSVNVNQSYTNENSNAAILPNETEVVSDKDKRIWFEGNFMETGSLKLNGYLIEKVKEKKY